ncbi:hypothetical protein B0H14DRAFT_2708050 [Mycena olivaceomarginata]|nr:hypothetical protein B0H14DRAFT_2708050 [Mycena olivaceomarginata]
MWLPGNLFRRTEIIESRRVGTHPGVRLHLECCAFPWDSPWYSHLTHLHLQNINPAQRPTLQTFLAILAGSPNLEILTIFGCSPTTNDCGFTVQLPRLTALTIKTGSLYACLSVLENLVIPSSATIDATVKGHDRDDEGHYELFSIFLKDPSPNTYDTVRIENMTASFRCSLHHSARPEWFRKLRIDAAWNYLHAVDIMQTICDHLDLSNVTTLHLRGMDCLPPPSSSVYDGDVPFRSTLSLWDTLGRALPRLHTLHLHKSFPALWLEFLLTEAMLFLGVSHYRSCFNLPVLPYAKLAPRLPFRDPDGALTLGWPSLRCIALHQINLYETVNGTLPVCADVLLALVWARRQGGVPVWRLEIDECVNVCRLPYFRLFADVVYNGKGGTDDEEVGQLESLRSYSIGVFAEMIELSRTRQ